MHGIEHGFSIVDDNAIVTPAAAVNHPSARPGNPQYEAVRCQVLNELTEGNYVVTADKPALISPLGAVPKPDGGVRLIHDCSRPTGQALNDHASLGETIRYQTIDNATDLIQAGFWCGKVDLKAAYRSVRINEASQQFTGLHFHIDGREVYMYDTKLPFGCRLAPEIFSRLTNAVQRMMARKGFTAMVVYLDDFFLCAPTIDECACAMATLVKLLRHLGFRINWSKVVDPTQCITFLGIEINTRSMCKRLPDDKVLALRRELEIFSKRKRASKRQLQSLAGKLNFAGRVVYGGRVFTRRIHDAISTLAAAGHKCVLSGEVCSDIDWWHKYMAYFNGVALIIEREHITPVFTDVCNVGAGGYYGGDWFYCNWAADWPCKGRHAYQSEGSRSRHAGRGQVGHSMGE